MGVYVCVWVCVSVSKLHLDRYFWRVPRGPSLCSSLSIEKRKQGKASASVPHLAGTIDFFFFFPRTRIRAKKTWKWSILFYSCRPFQLAPGVWFHSLSGYTQWACHCVAWWGMAWYVWGMYLGYMCVCCVPWGHPVPWWLVTWGIDRAAWEADYSTERPWWCFFFSFLLFIGPIIALRKYILTWWLNRPIEYSITLPYFFRHQIVHLSVELCLGKEREREQENGLDGWMESRFIVQCSSRKVKKQND